MAKLKITKEDKEEFKKTSNGAKKAIWMIVGMVIDFTATLGISMLNIFSSKLPNLVTYYLILFVLLVIVVLGGELIGIYYGALEQYMFHKHEDEKVIEDNTTSEINNNISNTSNEINDSFANNNIDNNTTNNTNENSSGKKVLGIDE